VIKLADKRKKLENNQVLGPDITDFLSADKGIKDNMAAGKATLGAIKKSKWPGKHMGDE